MDLFLFFATVDPKFKWEIDPVALAAFVIATISFIIALLTYLRDKPKAKVVVFRRANLLGQERKDIASITVTNVGRRPLTVSVIGYRTLWDFRGTSVIPTAYQQKNPKRLEEADTTTYVIKKADTLPGGKWKGVAYVLMSDSAGKEYIKYVAAFPLVLIHRFLEKILWPFMRLRKYFRKEED